MAADATGAPRLKGRLRSLALAIAVVALSAATPNAHAATSLGDYFDDFTSGGYGGTHGSLNWGWYWAEFGDDFNPTAGAIQVNPEPQCPGDPCLIIGMDGGDNAVVIRSADLRTADEATLSFTYKRHKHTGGGGHGEVRLSVASSAFGPWTVLHTFSLDASDSAALSQEHDITDWIAQFATIRFELVGGTSNSHLNVDNLRIELFDEDNVAPVLDPIPNRTIDEGVPFTFTATADDGNSGDDLTFSLDGSQPAGASMTAAGTFTWTPTEAQGPGIYSFDVIVTDNGSPAMSDSQTVTLTVAEVNDPPILNPIGDRSIAEGSLLSFTATAADTETATGELVYSLAGTVPAGAAITANGNFTWIPTEAQGPGTYTFSVVVIDDGIPQRSDTKSLTVTVHEANIPPLVDPLLPKTVAEKQLLQFTATATDADSPANSFVFSLQGAPSGAAITPGGQFTWRPTEAQGPGTYHFDVVATDDGVPAMAGSRSVTVTVTEVNTAPILEPIPDQFVDEGNRLTILTSASDADQPGNILTYSLVDGPAGAAISPTGLFTWIPDDSQGPGSFEFDIEVRDNGSPAMSDRQSVKITVADDNNAPVIDPLGTVQGTEGSLVTFTATAVDPDLPADDFVFSLFGNAPAGATMTPQGVFSWIPEESQGPGSYTFDVKATDDGSPPRSSYATVTVVVEANGLPPGAEFSSGGVLSWTPPGDAVGSDFLTWITATDDGTPALSDTAAFRLSVTSENLAPVLARIDPLEALVGEPITFTAVATDEDGDDSALRFSLSPDAPAAARINAVSGNFVWTPAEADDATTHTFSVIVTDADPVPKSGSTPVTITVGRPNVPPLIAAPPDQTHMPGDSVTVYVGGTDPDRFPEPTLLFSASNLPPGLEIDSVTGEITGVPGFDGIAGSPYEVRVNVYDGEIPAAATFVWHITGVANPPESTPGKASVISGVIEATAQPAAAEFEEPESSINRSLVLMSRAARSSISEMSMPFVLLFLGIGLILAFGRIGLVPVMRRSTRHTGVLRRLDLDTGSGLVLRDRDEADVFVHVSAIARRDRRHLEPGDPVTFRTVDGAYRDLVTKLRRKR